MSLSQRVRHITAEQIVSKHPINYNPQRPDDAGLCFWSHPYNDDETITAYDGGPEGSESSIVVSFWQDGSNPSRIENWFSQSGIIHVIWPIAETTYGTMIDSLAADFPNVDFGSLTECIENMFEDELED